MSKFIAIYLLAIWFATCKHWWYHAIIIPLSMFVFQAVSLFLFDFSEYQDETEFYYTIPFILIITIFLYGMRKLISRNVDIINLDDDIDKELEKIDRLDELKAKEKEKRARAGSRDINDLL